ncbi:MAG: transglycosylase SLT domain-containing protein [candidate division Zixibacteria bacterium]|jgi:Rod binding domain-containing protein|nr:transglycosylase SLT domain-containing protein [candidate division Zixibacteria bacterium]
MKAPAITAPPVQTDLERLRGQTGQTAEQEKARLKKATREFEAFFMYELLKTMRKTIPDGTMTEGAPLTGSMGKETFTQMFDMEIGRRIATGGAGSISDMLYRSLEDAIEARFRAADTAARGGPIPLERETAVPIKPEPVPIAKPVRQPIELPSKKEPMPVESPAKQSSTDVIRSRFGDLIDRAAEEHNLDSALIASVIRVESEGDPAAVSPAGAKGLMQLMDGTAAELGVVDSLDPAQNIEGGSRYLAAMLKRFGDVRLALAAYNAGPGAVERFDGVPPFRETREYVEKVTRLLDQTRSTDRSTAR